MEAVLDTLKIYERLKNADLSEKAAKEITEVLKDTEADVVTKQYFNLNLKELATKPEITEIKLEIIEIKAELKLLKWMMGIILAGVVSLVLKTFLIH